jgi:hypothetical protein
VDGVVTVVDSAAVAAGRFAHDHDKLDAQRQADEGLDHESPLEELFEDQLTAADLIILNKADLISAGDLEGVRAGILGHMSRKPVFVEARQGEVAPEVLLGLGIGTEDDIANRKSHHELHHEDGHEHDHDHDEFESFVVELGPVSDAAAFVEGLKTLIVSHDILRLKGFADIPGKPMRMVVQAVGSRIDTHFDRPWSGGETRQTRLVVIGLHDLDKNGDPHKPGCVGRVGAMHLLVAQKGSLSDGDEAVDLGQSPGDVLFLSAADTELASIAAARQMTGGLKWRLASLSDLKHPMSVDTFVARMARHAKLVIVRALGGASYFSYALESLHAASVAHGFKDCRPSRRRQA